MCIRDSIRNAWVNVLDFARQKLYQDYGMTELIGRLYQSIRKSEPPPIPYREIRLTSRIMDEIFSQIYGGHHVKAEANAYSYIE